MGIKFNESELQVVEISKSFRDAKVPVFNFPVSMKEGWKAMAHRTPAWLCTGVETFSFYPDIIPDNRARGFVNDGGIQLSNEEKGGKDMFGVEWVFVPVAGGTYYYVFHACNSSSISLSLAAISSYSSAVSVRTSSSTWS